MKFMWSHKIFDAQIKITWHIVKVLYSVMLQGMQGSSNHFRSERDRNVKCSNNNNNIYVCIIDKNKSLTFNWLRNKIHCWTITNHLSSIIFLINILNFYHKIRKYIL